MSNSKNSKFAEFSNSQREKYLIETENGNIYIKISVQNAGFFRYTYTLPTINFFFILSGIWKYRNFQFFENFSFGDYFSCISPSGL